MSSSIFVLLLLTSAYVVTVSMATREAEGQDTQPPRGHGDLCGYSPDQSLVCCIGQTMSTLIYEHEECCNGRLVGKGQMCCAETVPVSVTSPDHDDCCLDPDTLQSGVTFSSRSHYCNPDTGGVARKPFFNWFVNGAHDSQHSDLLSNVVSNRPASLSLQRHAPSSDRWCEAGSDENRSVGPRWHGEMALCCGRVSYFPSQQTCCASVLHDVPTDDTQCCYDQAYRRGDLNNPCLGRCGGSEFNSENELCCSGVIHASTSRSDVCCGREKISSDTHVCCGQGTVPVPKRGPHGCCRQTTPFIRRYMRCGRHGRLSRKNRGQFQASGLCRQLPTWGLHWPMMRLDGGHSQLVQIEGRVIHVNRSHHDNVHLTLNSTRLIQSPPTDALADTNTPCLESETIHLLADLGEAAGARGCQGRQLRRYLRDRVLTVFFPLNAFACTDSVPTVNVPVSSGQHLIVTAASQQ